jgi:hypothetical protein
MFARLRETRPVLSDEVPEEVKAEDIIILLVYKLVGSRDSDIRFRLCIIRSILYNTIYPTSHEA